MSTDFKHYSFLKHSFKVLLFYSLGVLIASIIWLPGILHMLQSNRIGHSNYTYDAWNLSNIGSFIMFTFVPRLNYIDPEQMGFFKDDLYYFHQNF